MPGLANKMGAAGKGLGSFWGVLRAGKRQAGTSIKGLVPGLANGMEAAEKGLGSFGEFCGLANGRLEPLQKDFAGWQKAGSNLHKRVCAGAGKQDGSCREGFRQYCGVLLRAGKRQA